MDWWLQRPLFASLPRKPPAVESRLGEHRRRPGVQPAARRHRTQLPLWTTLNQLEMPVLVVVGERDATYLRHGHRLVRHIGANAALAILPDAGHACHLEQPDAFLGAVLPFLDGRDH